MKQLFLWLLIAFTVAGTTSLNAQVKQLFLWLLIAFTVAGTTSLNAQVIKAGSKADTIENTIDKTVGAITGQAVDTNTTRTLQQELQVGIAGVKAIKAEYETLKAQNNGTIPPWGWALLVSAGLVLLLSILYFVVHKPLKQDIADLKTMIQGGAAVKTSIIALLICCAFAIGGCNATKIVTANGVKVTVPFGPPADSCRIVMIADYHTNTGANDSAIFMTICSDVAPNNLVKTVVNSIEK